MIDTRHLFSLVISRPAPLILLCTHAACTTAPDPAGPAADPVTASEQTIRGGTRATAYPEAALIDLEQGGAVVGRCSGAVIAPRVVLTAGHCVVGFDGFRISAPYAAGQSARATRAVTYDYVSTREEVDPTRHDVGLLFLDSPIALAHYPQIAGAPLRPGEHVLNIGRVRNGKASSSGLFVSKPVAVQPAERYGFPFAYVAAERIEHGDSGGPDVLPGPPPHQIVAVNSGAGAGVELLARIDDPIATWIHDQIASEAPATCPDHPAPCDPDAPQDGSCDPCACGDVTYAGECLGDVVVFCDDGLQTLDCAREGLSCGWDPDQQLAVCR